MPSKKKTQRATKKHTDTPSPTSLPAEVASYAEATRDFYSARQKTRLTALATDREMETVWPNLERELSELIARGELGKEGRILAARHKRYLARPKDNRPRSFRTPNRLVDFLLLHILQTALRADSQLFWWRTVPKKSEWNKRAKAIQEHAHSLRALLNEGLPRKEVTILDWPHRVFRPTDALNWVAIDRVQSNDSEVGSLLESLEPNALAYFRSRDINRFPFEPYSQDEPEIFDRLSKMLELVETLAEHANNLPSSWRTNRSGKRRRPVYVRTLSKYFTVLGLRPRRDTDTRPGFAFHAIIATISNVALSLSGDNALDRKKIIWMIRDRKDER